MSNKTILVGRIPSTTTPREVEELFSQHGTIEAVYIMTEHRADQSGRFAFVEMESQSEAVDAASGLDGYIWGDASLSVILAESPPRVIHRAQGLLS